MLNLISRFRERTYIGSVWEQRSEQDITTHDRRNNWRMCKTYNEELHNLYISPIISTKSERLRWAGHKLLHRLERLITTLQSVEP
jgi:hypothetical protein